MLLLAALLVVGSLMGCQKKEIHPGDVKGFDEGEQYFSIWVHSIEDTLDGPNVAAYAKNQIIQPLAPLTEEEKNEYLESIIEQGTYDNELYALGVMESSVGLYYNTEEREI